MFRRLIILFVLASSFSAEAKEFQVVRTGVFAMRTDMLVRAMVKELCSCWHVSGVGAGGPMIDGVETCLVRAQLPITPGLIKNLTNLEISDEQTMFEVDPSFLGVLVGLFIGDGAVARYDPDRSMYGCTLVE